MEYSPSGLGYHPSGLGCLPTWDWGTPGKGPGTSHWGKPPPPPQKAHRTSGSIIGCRWGTPPPVLTDTCENITSGRTTYVAVKLTQRGERPWRSPWIRKRSRSRVTSLYRYVPAWTVNSFYTLGSSKVTEIQRLDYTKLYDTLPVV